MDIKRTFKDAKRKVDAKWLKFKVNHPEAARFIQKTPYIFAGAVIGALGTAAVEKLESHGTSSDYDSVYEEGRKDGINFALDGVVRSTEYTDRDLYEAFKENGVKISNTKFAKK